MFNIFHPRVRVLGSVSILASVPVIPFIHLTRLRSFKLQEALDTAQLKIYLLLGLFSPLQHPAQDPTGWKSPRETLQKQNRCLTQSAPS